MKKHQHPLLIHLQASWKHVFSFQAFARSVALLAGGTAAGQLLVLLATPILTRLYLPEEMGRQGVYLSYIGFVSVIIAMRYEAAIVSAKDKNEAIHLLVGCLLLSLPMSFLCFLGLYIFIKFALLGYGILPLFAAFFAIPHLFIFSTSTSFRYWLVRDENYKILSQASLFQGGGRAFTQLGFGMTGLGWVGLILGDILGPGLAATRMVKSVYQSIGKEYRLQKEYLKKVLKKHYKFPVFLMPSSLIDNLAAGLPVPLLAYFYGAEKAGFYFLVYRVFSMPSSLIGNAVAEVFHGKIATLLRENPKETKPFFLKTATGLLLLGFIPAIFLILFGAPLFTAIFGARWNEAGNLVPIMVPWALAQLVISPLTRLVFVFQGQKLKLIYDFISLSTVIFALWLGYQNAYPLNQTVLLLSLGQVCAYVVYFILLYWLISNGIRKQSINVRNCRDHK